jgi:hypothetical protein
VRLTLAVRYVLLEEDSLETLGISAKLLYLDKGFASTEIVNYLTA